MELEGAKAMNAQQRTLQKNCAYEKMTLDTIFNKLRVREKSKKDITYIIDLKS